MKTIINGSRTIGDYEVVKKAIELSGIGITKVISGHARGPDRLGEKWAAQNGDETYLIFTGGEPIETPPVTYHEETENG